MITSINPTALVKTQLEKERNERLIQQYYASVVEHKSNLQGIYSIIQDVFPKAYDIGVTYVFKARSGIQFDFQFKCPHTLDGAAMLLKQYVTDTVGTAHVNRYLGYDTVATCSASFAKRKHQKTLTTAMRWQKGRLFLNLSPLVQRFEAFLEPFDAVSMNDIELHKYLHPEAGT